MARQSINLSVNGKFECAVIEPNTLLIDLVRDELGLTAASNACDGRVCGVCLLLLDGRPVHGCGVLAVTVEGRAIRTAEGLAGRDGTPHPVQQAFAACAAAACERCASAMLLASVALLENNPSPTREDVKRSLSGIACPCGGYAGVVDAVLYAARGSDPREQGAREAGSADALVAGAAFRPGPAAQGPAAEADAFAHQQSMDDPDDDMAERQGMDPVAFHLANLPSGCPEGFAACLGLAAKRVGWTEKWDGRGRPRAGRYRSGIGLSCTYGADAHAVFAEVMVDIEMGTVMLSAIAVAQVIGAADDELVIRRALEQDLIHRIGHTFGQGGRHVRLPTAMDVPESDFVFARSTAVAHTRPALASFSAAVANAVRDAAGIRLRTLPIHAGTVLPELIRNAVEVDTQIENEE